MQHELGEVRKSYLDVYAVATCPSGQHSVAVVGFVFVGLDIRSQLKLGCPQGLTGRLVCHSLAAVGKSLTPAVDDAIHVHPETIGRRALV